MTTTHPRRNLGESGRGHEVHVTLVCEPGAALPDVEESIKRAARRMITQAREDFR